MGQMLQERESRNARRVFCWLLVAYIALAGLLLCTSGCHATSLTPRQIWAMASQTYQQTVKSVLLLHEAGYVSDDELVNTSKSILLAYEALDAWKTALLNGTSYTEAVARFTENLDQLIMREQTGKERQANESGNGGVDSVPGPEGGGVAM